MSNYSVGARGAMKYFRTACNLLFLTLLVMLLVVPPNYGQNQCVAVPNQAILPLTGVMTGAGIGGTPQPGCAPAGGWAGAVPQPIPLTANTQTAYLFVAGSSGGGPNLDHLFVGVHVQGVPDLGINDHVTLYFHFGAGTAFTAQDFAIEYDMGATTLSADGTPTDAECSQDPYSAVRYYTFSSGWAAKAAPSGISAKKSWNFVSGQPDVGIWELEVGLDLTAAGLNIAVPSSGPGILRVGAQVYARNKTLVQNTVYLYPTGSLTANTGDFDYNPTNQSTAIADATNMQAFDAGTCNNDVMITAIKATDANGNANQFTRPTSVGGTANNQFSANVKFYNPANPADHSVLGSPNTGQVEFHILPSNATGTALQNLDITMGSPQVSFTQVNQELRVPASPNFIVWPQAATDWTQAIADAFKTVNADHACYIVKVSPNNGFNVNVVDDNDHMQGNLVFTTNSIVRDSFLISAKDPRLQPHNGYIDYVLRVNLSNVKSKKGWHFDFEDGDDIGLKKIAEGYYSLRLKPGEERVAKIELSGVLMPGTSRKYSVAATAGGTVLSPTSGTPPLDIPVKPNAVMSIVARRLIQLGANVPPNDANGVQQQTGGGVILEAARRAASINQQPASLLKDGYYHSSDHQGALIGSFDGFKTAFVVGTDSTFVVPSNANTLSLAINDQAGQYGANTGYFQVDVAASDPVLLPAAITQLPFANEGIPVQAASGSGLPRLDINVWQSVPDKKLLIPVGYMSWAIYESHKRSPFWWLWPGNWT